MTQPSMFKHWTEDIWIGFDTESTGTDPKTARILQFALYYDDPDGVLKENHIEYIDPGIEIPKEASDIHGITKEVLNQHKTFSPDCAIPWLWGWIHGSAYRRKYPMVIMNARYDWPLLLEECRRIEGFDYVDQVWPFFLDPIVIDRKLDKYRKGKRTLTDLAKHYGVELVGAHDALQDARASCGIMRAIVKKFPELKKYDILEMQEFQKKAFIEWRDGINQYWESTGKAERVEGSWPV